MCLHIAAQFDIVSSQLEKSISHKPKGSMMKNKSTKTDQKLTKQENDVLYEKLKKFVNFHNQTIDMCELFSRTFGAIAFLHFLAASIVICVCCMMLFLAEGLDKIIYQSYLLSALTDAFTYTYGGTLLIEASLRVKEAAYNFDWYNCDARNQQMILFIMIRARQETAVEVPFFKVSLETFVTVSDSKWIFRCWQYFFTDHSKCWILRCITENVFVNF